VHYAALACDFDGTLAHNGVVSPAVIDALKRCRDSGRKLLMVTGRVLADLKRTFSQLDMFDAVVVENGAVLYSPDLDSERPLANPPAESFVGALRSRGIGPISQGRVIIATWMPFETQVLETIRDLGLELQMIFNKGAVMILPSGVNKATGLMVALEELKLPPGRVIAIGDAENDHALLDAVGMGVAVANAVPMLREHAQWVTAGDHGQGVIELIDRLLADDFFDVPYPAKDRDVGESSHILNPPK
jgi:hydroxymethylpyrimidine pyrophosphatase-like HAD family hydrolase